eukprot:jgi/Orpsp1_1/1187506/evm.model.d7180000058221.1
MNNINNKNHLNNFKPLGHNNDLLMKQQMLRKTKSNNSIYVGWQTALTDQDKNLDFNDKMIWQRQSSSNILIDQNTLNSMNPNANGNNNININGNNGNATNSSILTNTVNGNSKYMRWSINEPISTDLWMNNGNGGNPNSNNISLKDSTTFGAMAMNDHNLSNKNSFSNIPINNGFDGYSYNNTLGQHKPQPPFYMNPLNNKMNTTNWDNSSNGPGPMDAFSNQDPSLNQNSNLMSNLAPGLKNNTSSNKLMLNQGQGQGQVQVQGQGQGQGQNQGQVSVQVQVQGQGQNGP